MKSLVYKNGVKLEEDLIARISASEYFSDMLIYICCAAYPNLSYVGLSTFNNYFKKHSHSL